jgi:acyl carrier protein
MSEASGIQPSIHAFILKKFPRARKRALDADVPLLESGIIDSLGVLEVVGFLETTFNLKIEDGELIPENFGNIRRIVSFVEKKESPNKSTLA